MDWAVHFGLVQEDGERFRRFAAARFARLAARAYPDVDAEALALATDWITFAFFLDDMVDTQGVLDPAYGAKLLAREQRLIELAKGARLRAEDTPLDRALDDIFQRVARRAGPAWRGRLAGHTVDYIEGCRWERALRIQGKIPSLATYSRLRPLVSAVFPCFDLAGIFLEGKSPGRSDGVYIRQLEWMASNHICWVNDIFGLDKELAEGTTSNLVIVLAKQFDLTQGQAVEQAVEMCNAELEAFEDLAFQVAPFANRRSQEYICALRAWMRGNLDWYGETSRYRLEADGSVPNCWTGWRPWME